MKKTLKFLISSTLVALCFLIPHKTQGMELVEAIYDLAVTYSSGHFGYYQEGTTFSTVPRYAQEAYQQSVLIYEKAPKELKQEKILMKAVQGQDDRVRISQTTQWPYNICTQLTMMFGGKLFGGSGCLVGPHHVLTCGHNVYNSEEKRWAEKVSVYPALNDNSAPFGEAQVVKVITFKGWVLGEDPTLDIALLILNKSIGKYTGWGGLLSDDEMKFSQETVHITGYPGDKGCKQMWSMIPKITTVKHEQFNYEIDTYPGQSGSPIWIKNYGLPMILGVHTLGSDSINSGVRLSRKKLADFVGIIAKTYILNSNTVLTLPQDDRIKPAAASARSPAISTVPLVASSVFMHSVPAVAPPVVIPPETKGYEEIYPEFLKEALIYRPQAVSNVGRIGMPIAPLAKPLEGTFYLSRCDGHTGKYLSISTGYQKAVKPENANKVEIWVISRRFLIQRELATTAHFRRIEYK